MSFLNMASFKALIILLLVVVLGIIEASDKNCNCVCGVRGRFNRIVGGQYSIPYQHPWSTALLQNGVLYCGATVISNYFLLTAAHCIYSFLPRDVSIYMGGNKLLEEKSLLWNASRFVYHERFDAVTFNNDIGLVRTTGFIKFGNNIQPACLPFAKDQEEYFGRLGVVTGWGKEGEKSPSSELLKHIFVPIWPQNKCLTSGYGRQRISDNMFCAGYEEGVYDACQGDSGGSLLMEQKTGSVTIVGIISWGRGCARANFPGIYTKVQNYQTWMSKILSKECLCQAKASDK